MAKVCEKCGAEFPNKLKIEGRVRVLNKRRFCLNCSPFGGHNTSKNPGSKPNNKRCPRCRQELPREEFYQRSNGKSAGWCKRCNNEIGLHRQRETKRRAIEYKGGKCQSCGYDKCEAALEFHHRNADKEFSIAKSKRKKFDCLKAELDKCDLLCANCHREAHWH